MKKRQTTVRKIIAIVMVFATVLTCVMTAVAEPIDDAEITQRVNELLEQEKRVPDDLAVLHELATLYSYLEDYPNAVIYAERIIAIDPLFPDAYLLKGYAQNSLKEYKGAYATLAQYASGLLEDALDGRLPQEMVGDYVDALQALGLINSCFLNGTEKGHEWFIVMIMMMDKNFIGFDQYPEQLGNAQLELANYFYERNELEAAEAMVDSLHDCWERYPDSRMPDQEERAQAILRTIHRKAG